MSTNTMKMVEIIKNRLEKRENNMSMEILRRQLDPERRRRKKDKSI